MFCSIRIGCVLFSQVRFFLVAVREFELVRLFSLSCANVRVRIESRCLRWSSRQPVCSLVLCATSQLNYVFSLISWKLGLICPFDSLRSFVDPHSCIESQSEVHCSAISYRVRIRRKKLRSSATDVFRPARAGQSDHWPASVRRHLARHCRVALDSATRLAQFVSGRLHSLPPSLCGRLLLVTVPLFSVPLPASGLDLLGLWTLVQPGCRSEPKEHNLRKNQRRLQDSLKSCGPHALVSNRPKRGGSGSWAESGPSG